MTTIRDLADDCTTLDAYRALCRECGTDPNAEQDLILSIGSEFLPADAISVRDGGYPTPEYWAWIADQTVLSQEEHDAEYQRSHAE